MMSHQTAAAYGAVLEAAGVKMPATEAWRAIKTAVDTGDQLMSYMLLGMPVAAMSAAASIPWWLEEKGVVGRRPELPEAEFGQVRDHMLTGYTDRTGRNVHMTQNPDFPSAYVKPSHVKQYADAFGKPMGRTPGEARKMVEDPNFGGWVNVTDRVPIDLGHELGHADPDRGFLSKVRGIDHATRGYTLAAGSLAGGIAGSLAQNAGMSAGTAGLIGAGVTLLPSLPMLIEEGRATYRGDEALPDALRAAGMDEAAVQEHVRASRARMAKAFTTYAGAVGAGALASGVTPWLSEQIARENAPWYKRPFM